MKYTFLCLLGFLFAANINAQTILGTIQHDGGTRAYRLHLPSGYDANQSYPFVYNLHGYTSNATEQEFYTGMNTTANENGFIVCHPDGLQNSWNVGFAGTSGADDVDFLVTLIDSLSAAYSINQDRIYSTGMSNGGFMSYKLACEASDVFAAVASVTGSMVPTAPAQCNPDRKVPVMQIHGTADATVQYNGTAFISIPIDDLIDFWTEMNECADEPTVIDIENTNTSDNSTAQRIEYTDCADDTEVVFYKIENGGHTWPDAVIDLPFLVTNRDFNANDVIWEFFNRFDINGEIVSDLENLTEVTDLEVFPNPVTDRLQVKNLPADTERILLIDAFGKTLKTLPNTDTIDAADLPQGVYFLRTEGKQTRGLVKFVKS